MYRQLIDWAEVWPLLIPLPFLLRAGKLPPYMVPVRIYVWVALVINLAATVIWKRFDLGLGELPRFWRSNNWLYNLHSVIRLLLFSWFFIRLDQRFLHRVKAALPWLFLAFVAVNFTLFENFFNYLSFSNRLLATEAACLLFLCLQFYIFLVIDEHTVKLNRQPGFWVVTGLTFFVALCFFIFLFYSYLTQEDMNFAVDIWDVHNFVFIFQCICIAIAFRQQRAE